MPWRYMKESGLNHLALLCVQDFASQVQVMEELKTQDKTLHKNTQARTRTLLTCRYLEGRTLTAAYT